MTYLERGDYSDHRGWSVQHQQVSPRLPLDEVEQLQERRSSAVGSGQQASSRGNGLQEQQPVTTSESHQGHSQTQCRFIFNGDEGEGLQQLRTEDTEYNYELPNREQACGM